MTRAEPLGRPDFPRSKANHRAVWSLSFRLVQAYERLFGTERALQLALDTAWVTRRYGLMLTGGRFGEEYHLHGHALTEELLLASIPRGSHVLDIGSGSGRWSMVAARRAARVTAVDHEPQAVQALRDRAVPGVEAVLLDAGRGVTQLGPFDVAVLSHVLEHLDDPVSLLRELRTCCSTLVIEVPDLESDPLNYARLRLGRPYYTDGDHVREYTLALLVSQLQDSGWQATMTRHRAGAVVARAEHIV